MMITAPMRVSFVVMFPLLAANVVFAQRASRVNARQRESVEITHLRRIEESVLTPTLVVGPPKHPAIADHYGAANGGLRNRLEEARRCFATDNGPAFRGMTLVAGSAGIGKTFIKREIYSDIGREHVWKFDVRELFEEFFQQGLAERKPDLQHGDRVYNRLLSLKPAGRKAFVSWLESNSAAFVVVDSLDEIHPDDYGFLLDQLERHALRDDQRFIHLVVFARPLAFQKYLQRGAGMGTRPGLRSFLLNKPDFRTTGDLTVSDWNFDCWKYGLCRGNSGEARPLRLTDYQRWCEQGFSTEGEFADVVFEKNDQMTPAARKALQRWSMEYPVVASVLPNLAANGIVREILTDCQRRGDAYDERRFMSDFLTKWLERDTRSDGRPSRLHPENLDVYLQLLEAIAAQYATEDRIDDMGYFDCSRDDQVTIRDRGELVSVPVASVLDRSGFVSVDPRTPMSQRFRFEPFWFHRLLVQMHQERQDRRIVMSSVTSPAR